MFQSSNRLGRALTRANVVGKSLVTFQASALRPVRQRFPIKILLVLPIKTRLIRAKKRWFEQSVAKVQQLVSLCVHRVVGDLSLTVRNRPFVSILCTCVRQHSNRSLLPPPSPSNCPKGYGKPNGRKRDANKSQVHHFLQVC